MTDDVREVCRDILRITDPEQEFLLDENFDFYAKGYPEPTFLPEGRFEAAQFAMFVSVLVPFVVEIFKGAVKDALKDNLKEALTRLFRRESTARAEEIKTVRSDLEKIIAQTKLSEREKGRLRERLYSALDSIASHPTTP